MNQGLRRTIFHYGIGAEIGQPLLARDATLMELSELPGAALTDTKWGTGVSAGLVSHHGTKATMVRQLNR
jgi:hypothetical protein